MAAVTHLPNLEGLVTPILRTPYAHFAVPGAPEPNACYGLLRYLFKQGFDLDFPTDPAEIARAIVELWYRGDPRDPLMLAQPWDGYVLATKAPWSDHVGLVVSATHFVNVRKRTGVCLEPLQQWRSRLLQMVRLRMLL